MLPSDALVDTLRFLNRRDIDNVEITSRYFCATVEKKLGAYCLRKLLHVYFYHCGIPLHRPVPASRLWPRVVGAFVWPTVAFARKILRKEWTVEVAVDKNSEIYFEGSFVDAILHFFARIRSSQVEVVRIDAPKHLPEKFFQVFAEVGPTLRPHTLIIYTDLLKFSASDVEKAILSIPAVGRIFLDESLMLRNQVTDNFLRECVKKRVYYLCLPQLPFNISEEAIIAYCCSTSHIWKDKPWRQQRYLRVAKDLVSRHFVLHLFKKWNGPADPGFRLEIPGAVASDFDLTSWECYRCDELQHDHRFCTPNGLTLTFYDEAVHGPDALRMTIAGYSVSTWEVTCDGLGHRCRGMLGVKQ